MKTDLKNKNCFRCKKGKYIEISLLDDFYGILHCDKCHNVVKRYIDSNYHWLLQKYK